MHQQRDATNEYNRKKGRIVPMLLYSPAPPTVQLPNILALMYAWIAVHIPNILPVIITDIPIPASPSEAL